MRTFIISLDFELMWGSKATRSIASYGKNILGLREVVPQMLKTFKKHQVTATWAAVGMALFGDKKTLLANLPAHLPNYRRQSLSPYAGRYLDLIGNDERSDPLHFGLSLGKMIADCEGMELASHTFSHFYCLEQGQEKEAFQADLEASINATMRVGQRPTSLVFPNNQYNPQYLGICAALGFTAYRGNQEHWIYRASPDNSKEKLQRAARFLDAYVDLTGGHAFDPSFQNGLVNIPSSRFLRPYVRMISSLEPLRIHRIKQAMTQAAVNGKSFHLWWHPENFGVFREANIAVLDELLRHHVWLRDTYGVRSMTMKEVANELRHQARDGK